MSRYVVAVAGNYTMWQDPANPGIQQPLPANCSVTYIPDYTWPLFHKAFGKDDLTGMWWYAPAIDAIPVIESALDYFDTNSASLAPLLDRQDWRGVRGNRAVLSRILEDLKAYEDNVIAWGSE